ncbi:TauD/TfdA family dioxygenase [Endozoicomonas arenosclerae]|uniref:TauD/TfdA family dioxygenase n=1 Tax=Endozoicomonas arenosclerae TaxID=1633495 RepID=UPI000AD918C7|nr:TauD/TfdA family dioxygenase [Endozoicomonas arenosclerae]
MSRVDSSVIKLSEEQVMCLEQLVKAALKSFLINNERLFLPEPAELSELVSQCKHILNSESGLLILRQIPLDRLTPRERNFMMWSIGSWIGRPLPQNFNGDLLGRVENAYEEGDDLRGYQPEKELPLHTDRGDVVCLLCVRPALQGGESLFASVHSIHHYLLTHHPEVLSVLAKGFHMGLPLEKYSISGCQVPVLAVENGFMSAYYVRAFIDFAAEVMGWAFSTEELHALACFEKACRHPEIRYQIKLQRGDLAIWNNHTWLHGRTAFSDFSGGNKSDHRLMLRLWLRSATDWPMPVSMWLHKCTDLGVVNRHR